MPIHIISYTGILVIVSKLNRLAINIHAVNPYELRAYFNDNTIWNQSTATNSMPFIAVMNSIRNTLS